MDPSSENYETSSSYAYVLNNPVDLVDFDGRDTARKLKEVKIVGVKKKAFIPRSGPIVIEPPKRLDEPLELPRFPIPSIAITLGLTLVFVLIPENWNEHGEKDDLARLNAIRNSKHGSYTIKFKNGKRYHGKGPYSRALQSAKTLAEKYKTSYDFRDIDWTPAPTEADAFRDEAKRIENDGGKTNPDNYNERDSPGNHKYKQDQ